MVWFSWTPRAQAPSGLSVAAERNSKACRKLLRSFTKIHNSLRSDNGFLRITQFPAGQEFLLCFHRKSRRVYARGADIGEAIFEGSCDRGNEKQAEVFELLPACIRRESKLCIMPIGSCPDLARIIPKALLKFSSLTIDSVFIYIGIGIHFNSRWF